MTVTDLVKAPGDLLDFLWDWTDFLGDDTIASVTWTATGLTNTLASNTTTTATVWLGGGTAAQGYPVTCQITTAAGRTAQYTEVVHVMNL